MISFYDIIWYISVWFAIAGFLTKSRNRMLIYGIISTLLLWICVYFYWWYNWLSVSIISVVVKLLSLFVNKKYLKYIKYSTPFVALWLFFILPEWIEWIIPALSMFFIIVADSQKDVLKMKYWYYGSNLLWLSYGIILFSIPAILFDTFWFLSLTYGVYKIRKDRKKLT